MNGERIGGGLNKRLRAGVMGTRRHFAALLARNHYRSPLQPPETEEDESPRGNLYPKQSVQMCERGRVDYAESWEAQLINDIWDPIPEKQLS